MDFSTIRAIAIPQGNVKSLAINGATVWSKGGPEPVTPDYLCLTAEEAGSTISMKANGSAPSVSLEYSTDKTTWTPFVVGTTTITLVHVGDKCYLRGDNVQLGSSSAKYNQFVMSGKISASGNAMSLLDKTVESISISKTHAFISLFDGCASLVTAPELPATTLANNCYRYMFRGTSIVTAPELPATTLATYCYQYMFDGCTSLVTAPELPATTLATYCYSRMFQGCTSLVTAPELPATTLANYCYQYMFDGCTSLVTAPELPATTLATYCYQYMFQGCTSLVNAPELPATTLATYCYQYMFDGCTSLVTAPELPATTLANYCYSRMFQGCTSLVNAPELPATTLATYCYQSMFQGCTSLVNAPELPATTLANYCYQSMFYDCRKLNLINASFTSWTAGISSPTGTWVNGVEKQGTFICPSTLPDERGTSKIPSGWTKVDK